MTEKDGEFKEALEGVAELIALKNKEIKELRTRVADLEEAHKVLDEDPSRIIRNEKDGYPDGRPDRILTLAERVKAICKYGADYNRWLDEAENRLSTVEKENERLVHQKWSNQDKYDELLKASEGMEKALERISQDDVHVLMQDGRCVYADENDVCECQGREATEALADFRALKETK